MGGEGAPADLSRHELAVRAEQRAEDALAKARGESEHPATNDHVVSLLLAEATAWGALAQSYRTAEVAELLGDGSYLDRIRAELRDGLDAIRAGIEGT